MGRLGQQAATLPGREVAPGGGLEAAARRRHGIVDVGGVAGGHVGDHVFGGGVDDREALSRERRPPLVIDEEGGLHRPLNSATRFSLYAAMPSFASSLWNSCCCSSRSIASADSNGTSAPDCTARLISPTAFDALCGGQNCFAYSCTCSQNPSTGKTSLTRPISLARSNENVSPFTISSMASGLPTMRARRCVPPVPGSTPRLTSGSPILPAFSLASRMSHAIAISSPPPTV